MYFCTVLHHSNQLDDIVNKSTFSSRKTFLELILFFSICIFFLNFWHVLFFSFFFQSVTFFFQSVTFIFDLDFFFLNRFFFFKLDSGFCHFKLEYIWALRSFGHQGALYYVFLASDPLKTLREYTVFTLRTRGPKVCIRETSHETQRVSAFLFWLRQTIALLHTSRGKLAARTKFHNVLWKTKGLVRMITSKILCKRQKWDRSRPICIHNYFCFVSFKSCMIRSKYSIAINKIRT